MSFFQDKFKNHTNKLGLFFLAIIFLVLITILLSAFINSFFSIDLIVSKKLQLLSFHLCIFLFPTMLFSYLYNFNLRINNFPSRQSILLSICIVAIAIPAIEFLHQINQLFFSSPKELSQLQKDLLQIDSISGLIFNLFVIAVIPAIGEEFLFRGVLQQRLTRSLPKAHLAIFFTAFLFSAIHLDAGGFLPRFVLGLLLGYIFYWSKNLWLPIIIHFINNAILVTASYLNKDEFIEISKNTTLINWKEGVVSFFAVALLLFLLKKNLSTKDLNQ